MKTRYYKSPDGAKYPLAEAEYDMTIHVYRSDCKKAKRNNPWECIIALGAKHHPDVKEAFIGSGKDAYIIFKGVGKRAAHAKHFTIPTNSARVRDGFDVKGAARIQNIILRMPTAGRTLIARRAMDRRRRHEIKSGSPVKHRSVQKKRIMRIGVEARPRAQFVKDTVSIERQAA